MRLRPPRRKQRGSRARDSPAARDVQGLVVDELPEIITKVVAEYPDSTRDAGIQGTVTRGAPVCRMGQIYST
jgi:hypothetical protein